ncbi:Neopullulanase [compost metagenome]
MGTPCIYYGDEFGMDGENDPGCRKCMEWDPEKQDHDLFSFYRKLIEIRSNHPALRSGSFTFLEAGRDGSKLAFERSLGDEVIIILMNTEETAQTFRLDVEERNWTDLFTGDSLHAERGKLSLKLPAYGYTAIKAIL